MTAVLEAVRESVELVRYSAELLGELTPSKKKLPRAWSKVIPWL